MENQSDLSPFEKREKYARHLRAKQAVLCVLEAIAALSKVDLWPAPNSDRSVEGVIERLTWLREACEQHLLNDKEENVLRLELAQTYGGL